MNLSAYLPELEQSKTLFIDGDETVTVSHFIERVNYLKGFLSHLHNKNVVVQLHSDYDFISAIVAMDGICKSMFLLPADTDDQLRESLSLDAKSDFLLRELPSINESLKPQASKKSLNEVDTNWILATSGTTGKPKLIHHNIKSLLRTCKKTHQNSNNNVWALLYQPQRYAGLQVVLQVIVAGNTLVLTKGIFEQQVKSIMNGQTNCLSATPSMWRKLLINGSIKKLHFKQITLGGEAVDSNILTNLVKEFPSARVVHIYASTEAGVGFVVKDKQVGFPLQWLETGVDNVELKLSVNNTLLLKQKIMPKGNEIDNRLDIDGYFDTEDVVEINNDRVIFLGRDSGVINVGGNKVHPEEIESILRGFDLIADVRVYPKKNPMIGQLVAADIVLTESFDNHKEIKKQITGLCKEYLPLYKVPNIIRIVDSISLNFNGKVERKS
ncbi:class I adenylate-forming enzyme family protein [Gammaproteobacteria bacterium AS21]